MISQALQGTTHLEKVVFLDLGYSKINDHFAEWIAGVLERCPKFEKAGDSQYSLLRPSMKHRSSWGNDVVPL